MQTGFTGFEVLDFPAWLLSTGFEVLGSPACILSTGFEVLSLAESKVMGVPGPLSSPGFRVQHNGLRTLGAPAVLLGKGFVLWAIHLSS